MLVKRDHFHRDRDEKKIFETTTGQKITDYGLYEEHQPEENDTVDGRTPAPPGMSKIL